MNIDIVKQSIRDVPDFPKPGILFKDITTALKDKDVFNFLCNEVFERYKHKGITKVVGIESRGFILGSALAYKLNAGFIPLRKPGKLPAATFSKSYQLEYGTDSLEIHQDALTQDDIVLIHDDLLATGGTAGAAYELVQSFGVKNIFVSFIIELSFLQGIKKFSNPENVSALINY